MRTIVTGAAGFIGSTLSDALLAAGHQVLGIDCITPYYSPRLKRSNLSHALEHPKFELLEADLRTAELKPVFDGIDVVFHQAAQPGVRMSWSEHFEEYSSNNVLATQRLLEAAQESQITRLVYASSSSVYGNAEHYPTVETDRPMPYNPYGVTKLAAEHLCNLYASNWSVPTISLRYFTVFGPRQRPDMAFHRLVRAALVGGRFPLYGDGRQRRDFTFVSDVVDANIRAAQADVAPGTVLNIAGGNTIELRTAVSIVEKLTGTAMQIDQKMAEPGDVQETGGSIDRARAVLGWEPTTTVESGLAAQVAFQRGTLGGE